MRRLHDLYLVTLLIAVVMTVTSVAVPAPVPDVVRWLVPGSTAVVLAAADILVRRCSVVAGRPGTTTGYLVLVGAVIGLLTAVFPTFAVVAFGALPLAFVLLRRLVALVVGLLLVALPYLVQPYALGWLSGAGAPSGMLVRFGPGYLITVGVALPVLTGLFTASAIHAVRRQSQARQLALEQLAATRAELAAASRLAGRTEERQRLAHELHDTLAQGLSGVVLQLGAAEQLLDPDAAPDGSAESARLVRLALQTARGCLSDTRRAVEALRPEPLDRADLAAALAQVCRRWTGSSGVPVRLQVQGRQHRCDPRLEVVGLRVVQEALANVAKHADADAVTITAEYRQDGLRLTVHDDGRGFEPAHPPVPDGCVSGGLGLPTLEERITAVGGSLAVTSAPGGGTTVTAMLPEPVAPVAGAHP